MRASGLTDQLHEMFETCPPEVRQIDVVRALRWPVEDQKEVRIQCLTAPTGVSLPDKRLLGESPYPRTYIVDLSFPADDDSGASVRVARAVWQVTKASEPPQIKPPREVWYFDKGIDPFDLVDLGSMAPPSPQDRVFSIGLPKTDPNIWVPDGVSKLLDCRRV